VLPVRFISAGQAVQCTTRELSVASAFLSCATPPKAGATISLRLYLPGIATPESLTASVRAPTTAADARGAGFWADFLPGHDAAQERITAVLVRVAQERGEPASGVDDLAGQAPAGGWMAPPATSPPPPSGTVPASGLQRALAPLLKKKSGAERRVDRRLENAAPMAVRFATVEDFVLEYAANISSGGIFIKTIAPPSLESVVRLQIELPDGGPPLEVEGVVLHRLDAVQAGPNRDPGAGVQFVRTDPDFRERIERFLDSVVKGQT